jgi:hypothetical protein
VKESIFTSTNSIELSEEQSIIVVHGDLKLNGLHSYHIHYFPNYRVCLLAYYQTE